MNFRDFFARNNDIANDVTPETKIRHSKRDITCDTAKLKRVIKKWTKNGGWKYNNFADFIELAGVKTPVKLSNYNENSNSFKCITALGTENSISLSFDEWKAFRPQMIVTDGEEKRYYITNTNSQKGKDEPKVILQNRIIQRNGKTLENYYCEYFCNRMLKLDDTHVLKVEIDEPDKYDKKSKILVLQNCEEIEEYLLGLDNSLVVSEVYENVLKILNFSNEDISKCGRFLVCYTETIGDEVCVRGKTLLTNGKIKEYVTFKNRSIT